MSSGYYYNNINITSYIQSGNSAVPGFNINATPLQYSSGFDKPGNFSYTYQGTDISNYTAAIYIAESNTYSGNIPLLIPNTNGSYFKYVSVCGCGGGGGGGGGGDFIYGNFDGGNGGSGGDGAYGAVLNYPVSGANSLSYNIGKGGSGSNGTGSPGNNTSVSVGNTTIISCDGGNGGAPGNGTPGFANGNDGNSGNTPDSKVVSGNITTNTSGYPPQSGNYAGPDTGNGGGGGGGNGTDKSYSPGGDGNNGFVLVYFSI